jgi:hypothetical protein
MPCVENLAFHRVKFWINFIIICCQEINLLQLGVIKYVSCNSQNRIRKSSSYKTDFFHGTGIEICLWHFLIGKKESKTQS